jgi:S1-C subfamily serine protease
MSLFDELSNATSALAEQIAPRILAVRGARGRVSSGFVWCTGLAVTATEVLEGDDEVEVAWVVGQVLKASIVGRDPATDVALLTFETGAFADWPLAAVPRPASLALVAGRGESLLATATSVIEAGPAWRSLRGGQIDARIGLGLRLPSALEGGAVVAPDATLIGMAVLSARRSAIVIPASTIARAVATLAERGYVPRGWLGVMLHAIVQGPGTIVLSVEAQSPAARAGLLVGDVITTWDGEAVASVGALAARLGAGSVGTRVTLGVLRGGNAITVDVTLDERPRG